MDVFSMRRFTLGGAYEEKEPCLVLALFFSFFLTACTQKASDPNQDNWAKYQKQGSITIGFDNTFVPMEFEERTASMQALILTWPKLFLEKLGIQIKFQPINWDMKETELQNGTIDAIWNGYTATDERKEKVAFTIPYMENQQVLVSKKSQNIHSIQDMTDKVLGAQAGSSGYLNFEGQPELLKNRVKIRRPINTKVSMKP